MSPTIDDLSTSKYITKKDVIPDILVTIRGWEIQDVSADNDPTDEKYILNFDEDVKPLVLNKTNFAFITTITGEQDADNWAGCKIVLWHDPTIMFKGEIKGGTRVRAPKRVPDTPVEADNAPPTGDDIPF